jgi:hypothetical protein
MTSDNNLAHELGLVPASALVSKAARSLEDATLRARFDGARKSVARAGRFRYARVSAALFLVSLIAAGVFSLVVKHPLVGAFAISVVGGAFVAILLVDPQAIVRHVEAMESAAEGTCKQWRNHQRTGTRPASSIINDWLEKALPVAGVAGVRITLAEALDRAGATKLDLKGLYSAALTKNVVAVESVGALRAKLSNATSSWRARLSTLRVRRTSHAIINAVSVRVDSERHILAIEAATAALQAVIDSLQTAIAEVEDKLCVPAERLLQEYRSVITEMGAQDGRTLAGKAVPSANAIAAGARRAVECELPGILRRLAAKAPNDNLVESISDEVQRIVSIMADTTGGLRSWLDVDGGVFGQIDSEAGEFCVSRVTPGRVQRRIRWVLCEGGASSPVFETIRRHSAGAIVRAIDHGDPSEIVVFTESRYEPGAEIVEFTDAISALDAVDADSKAAMITSVENDTLILHSRAEQGDDQREAERRLALAMAYQKVARDASERYRLLNGAASGRPRAVIAQGFAEAAGEIHGDPQLADALSIAIEAYETTNGAVTAARAIDEAMTKPEFVPLAFHNRIREMLLIERDRLLGVSSTDA